MNAIVVMTTVGDKEAGEKLASALVVQKLAACVQILPPMLSVYRWQENIEKESECLLLIKTTEDSWDALSAFISANHPYDVPELIALKAAKVAEGYSKWLADAVAS